VADRTVSVRLTLKNDGFVAGLKQANRQAKDFTDGLSKNVQKNKGDLDTMARGLGVVGLAAGAGIAVAVKKFADFDQAMSGVQAATHETAGNMLELREAAIKAGKDTAFSATEAAAGIENLAKAGVSTKDILGGGLAGALDLAAAGELGVADAAEVAATAMTQFKLSGDEVPHVADLLAAAAGKAQGEVSDMAYALKQGGLVAAQMGLSIEETTGTLASFASAGLLGSDAGTSLKTMLLALANPSVKAAGVLKELGINVYDANGAFMGMAPLAEQLKTKLGGVSEQTRNAALATIFGSDAIRAASVLYNEGAAGIAEWTDKVNDQGFAAETAAIKTDNLKGDIERLGGSIDTALIQQGSGANDALRGLAQGAGLLVDGIGNLPESVSKVGLALGAVATVGGLGAAGLLKAASAASEAREAWQNLGATGRRLTLAMGAVGVAITAGLILYGAFTKKNAEAKQRAEDLRQTLDEQTGAITGNTKAYVANELAQNGLAQKAKDLGFNLSTITEAALGNESALKGVVSQLDKMIEAGKTNGPVTTQAAYDLYQEGAAAQALKDALFGTNKQLTEAQRVQKLAGEGAKEHKTAQELQADAVKKANEKIKEETESLDDLIDRMHAASGAALSLSGAQISFQESLDDATASIKENGRTLNISTAEGRANRSALNDLAEAANDQTDAMLKSGKSNDVARKTAVTARAEFIKVATQMGLNKKQAEALATSLIDIPDAVNTNVTNTAGAAKRQAEDYKTNGLDKLPKNVPTHVSITNLHQSKKDVGDFATHVTQTLRGIKDEAIRVNLAYTSSLGQNPKNKNNFATGGPVFGAGTATSDSIPAMLSNNEHVWTAKEVQAAGGHGAVKKMRQGVLKGYAAGGDVHIGLNASTPSGAAVQGVADGIARFYGQEIAKKSQEVLGVGGPPGSVQTFRGKRLNARTIAMLLNAERILGARFHITQGSYSTSVAASGSTHAGGGAMDTDGPRGWGAAVAALRKANFAAWHRTPSQGPWGHHIHSIAIGDSSASPAAKRQVQSFLSGGNGLGGGGKSANQRAVTSGGLGYSTSKQTFSDGGPVALGYRNGGVLRPGQYAYNETREPEAVLNKTQFADLASPAVDYDKLAESMLRAMSTAGVGTVYATIPIEVGGEVRRVVRTEVKTMNREAARSYEIGG
jgi:TP901 family phage tail tape measure protein